MLVAGQGDAREMIRTGEGASREQDRAGWSCTPNKAKPPGSSLLRGGCPFWGHLLPICRHPAPPVRGFFSHRLQEGAKGRSLRVHRPRALASA